MGPHLSPGGGWGIKQWARETQVTHGSADTRSVPQAEGLGQGGQSSEGCAVAGGGEGCQLFPVSVLHAKRCATHSPQGKRPPALAHPVSQQHLQEVHTFQTV